jgi:hypothetical protein
MKEASKVGIPSQLLLRTSLFPFQLVHLSISWQGDDEYPKCSYQHHTMMLINELASGLINNLTLVLTNKLSVLINAPGY